MRGSRAHLSLSFLLLASTNAFGLSCGYVSEKELVDTYEHILVVLVTNAFFTPDSDDNPLQGKITASFETLSVIKGNPEKVTHIEAKVRGPNDNWPAQIPVGQRIVLVSNDGHAKWGSCNHHFRLGDTPNGNCKIYLLQKFLGQQQVENQRCESKYLWQAFKDKKVEPESKRGDLAGLRREWVEQFGMLPE